MAARGCAGARGEGGPGCKRRSHRRCLRCEAGGGKPPSSGTIFSNDMKRNRIWRVAGISFEHFHMGDLLKLVFAHPRAEIVGICDEQPARMQSAIRDFSIPASRVFTDYRACLEKSKPDLVILCPATARHAWFVERVAPG